MSNPEEQPNPEAALARAHAARAKMAAALDEDQEPEPDEPWDGSRSRSGPGSRNRRQRRSRSCASSGGDSRTPDAAALPQRNRAGPAPGRTGSATQPRAATPAPFPVCATSPPGLVTMPGAVHRVEPTMFCIQWRCTISSVFHRVDSTQWVAANLKSQVKGLV